MWKLALLNEHSLSQQVTNVIRWEVISKELKVLAKKKAVEVQDVQVSQHPQAILVCINLEKMLFISKEPGVLIYVFFILFQKAILVYNQKYKAHWSFDALDKFVMVSVFVHFNFNF